MKITKLFLRISLAIAFLSAVADRFGWYPEAISAWGNWKNFVDYTAVLNPWAPAPLIPTLAIFATLLEVVFAIGLLIGFRTELIAKLSGILLLMFGLSMMITSGIKAPLDYSVFTASAAAFALSGMKEKHLELDELF